MELPLHTLPLCCHSLVTGYFHRMAVLFRPTDTAEAEAQWCDRLCCNEPQELHEPQENTTPVCYRTVSPTDTPLFTLHANLPQRPSQFGSFSLCDLTTTPQPVQMVQGSRHRYEQPIKTDIHIYCMYA